MRRRSAILARTIIVGLPVVAFFLVYPFLPRQSIGTAAYELSVTVDLELLATAILWVSVGLWVTFADKEAKEWERLLLLTGFSGGAIFSWFLGYTFWVALDHPGWADTNPIAANNLSVAAQYMFIIGLILVLAAIIVARQNTKLKKQTNPLP